MERIIEINMKKYKGWKEAGIKKKQQLENNKILICTYCNVKRTTIKYMTYDHVWPRSKGGKETESNLVISCRSCNNRLGDNYSLKKDIIAGRVIQLYPKGHCGNTAKKPTPKNGSKAFILKQTEANSSAG